MTKIKKITIPIFILSAAAVLFTSCGAGTTDRLTTAEVESIENYLMSSYFMLRGDAELPDSRAAWDYTKEVQLPTAGNTTTAKSQNYPEKGQSTEVTISVQDAAASVYKVVNVTSYPKQPSIVSTTESYYIKDNSDGYLNKTGATTADYICDETGDTSPANSNSRIMFQTQYADGSIRYEQVAANTYDVVGGNGVKYAAFDIDGDLTFPAGTSYSPENDSNAHFSSAVNYVQEYGNPFDFNNAYTIIVGTRYYTETGSNPEKPLKTSVSYERAFTREAIEKPEDLISTLTADLFSGDDFNIKVSETVIRYRIEANSGKKTVKTKTEVFDINEASVVSFTATYETADDGTVLQSGLPVASYY